MAQRERFCFQFYLPLFKYLLRSNNGEERMEAPVEIVSSRREDKGRMDRHKNLWVGLIVIFILEFKVVFKMNYKVIIEPDTESGGNVVYCLTLTGCVSEGETIDEALENIKKAMKGYVR